MDQPLTAPAHAHTQRARWISWMAIGVSFAHMATTMLLFEPSTWFGGPVGAANTLLVDVTIWILVEYRHWMRAQNRTYSPWIDRLFSLTLMIAVALNAGSLWAHRPAESVMPTLASALIVIAFSPLAPGIIAVAAIMRSEIVVQATQQAEDQTTRAQMQTHIADLLKQLKAALQERDAARQLAQQHQATFTVMREQVDQAVEDRAALELLRAQLAQIEQVVREERARAAQHEKEVAYYQNQHAQVLRERDQLQQEAAQLQDALPFDNMVVAQRLIALGVKQREAAELLRMPESTLRSQLKKHAQQNGISRECIIETVRLS